MSLFGKKENRTLTGTVSVTNGSTTVTGTGTAFLTEVKPGWVLNVGSQRFVVKRVVSNTSLTVHAASSTTASGQTATITEVPVWLKDSDKLFVYGVDTTEAAVNKISPGWVLVKPYTGAVKELVVTNPGTGLATPPTVTITGGTYTVQATAVASVQNGKITKITVTNPGSYSGTVPPTASITRASYSFNTGTAVNSANETITITGHGFVTGDAFQYSKNSGTVNIGLTEGTYYAIVVNANTIKVATSYANALAGIAVDLTATGNETHVIYGVQPTATVVMSGKFGRKRREVLVSMKVSAAEMGDRENTEFPNS